MPTNLPPEYFEVEKRYRAARSPEEKLALLQELLSTIPKHKGTEKLRGDLKKRLARLKAAAQSPRGASRRASAFHVEREGAGQVVVVGPTNVGKSALLTALTNATPKVSASPYTTWTPTAGMMPIADIQVQLVDTPPLGRGFVQPELFELIKRSDLILLVVDLLTDPLQQIEETAALLEEHRIVPRHRQDRYPGQERLTFLPVIVLANKDDGPDSDELFAIFSGLVEAEWTLIPVSATAGRNFERLKELVFEQLDIVRVYSKAPGREPDLAAPFVLKRGSTVADLAAKVHHDFVEKLKMARIWGTALYDGQPVQQDHVLHDGDVVELHM